MPACCCWTSMPPPSSCAPTPSRVEANRAGWSSGEVNCQSITAPSKTFGRSSITVNGGRPPPLRQAIVRWRTRSSRRSTGISRTLRKVTVSEPRSTSARTRRARASSAGVTYSSPCCQATSSMRNATVLSRPISRRVSVSKPTTGRAGSTSPASRVPGTSTAMAISSMPNSCRTGSRSTVSRPRPTSVACGPFSITTRTTASASALSSSAHAGRVTLAVGTATGRPRTGGCAPRRAVAGALASRASVASSANGAARFRTSGNRELRAGA